MKSIIKRKRLFVVTLIICLCYCISANAAFFTDVNASMDTRHRDAINYVTDNGIFLGTSTTTFSPDECVTRAMVVTVLYRLSGDTGTYSASFTDISPNSSYYNAVGWGVENGIVNGTTETTFEPHELVTKQQLAAFLYRFAGYEGLQRLVTESITSAMDYASVSNYAKVPLAWVYSYAIYPRSSITESITPNAYVARKDLAVFLQNYRMNVEGMVFGRDTFSFINSSSQFVSNPSTTYLISSSDLYRLSIAAYNYGGLSSVIDSMQINWSGSCYGMSIAAALDYWGKIDFNGNSCYNSKTIYSIPALNNLSSAEHRYVSDYRSSSTTISDAESKINMLQHSWHITPIKNWARYITTDNGLRELVLGQEHGGIGVFCYTFANSGHAVIVYGKPVATSTGYKLSVYDNRCSSAPVTLYINTTSSSWTGYIAYGSTTEVISSCKYENRFDVYDILDYDGLSNQLSATSQHAALSIDEPSNDEIFEEYMLFDIIVNGNFEMTDAEGHYLIVNEKGIESTIETYRQNLIPTGSDTREYLFVVPYSETYSITSNKSLQFVSVFGKNGYSHATEKEGNNGIFSSVVVTENGKCTEVVA